MMFLTHLLFGLFCGLVTLNIFSPKNMIVYFSLVVVGSMLPDIDCADSRSSKAAGIFGKISSALLRHRGILHSIWPILAVWFLFESFNGRAWSIPLLVGYSSHLFIDMFNHAGIRVFHPINFHIKGFIKAGSISEKAVMMIIFVLDIFLILSL